MNDSRGVDRRIIRTRVMISEAFLNILPQKSFAEISVVDIAEQANINRSTFYAHFLDKDDLLDSMVNEKFQLLDQLLTKRNTRLGSLPSLNEPDPIFSVLFEHILEHDEFYRVMLLIDPAGNFNSRLNELIRETFFDRISHSDMVQKEVPLDILLDHISFSTTGIIYRWLADTKVCSPHYMALQLTRIALLGTYQAMGVSG
ncbi:TetR/AcrR family transcriptional regulator [Paenibacillus pabuli]|uniref:TetR/AcrR family transcriptional regulator n=1 Tax=Paenibacillus pabuli TaxID=1472 RepID=UPI001FFEC955|nr:TetR/AcrR family transcriptional regulator C-terminal domain-containing protein [Paenibacillus pabuli]UPK42447.1 TetR/AcrR family transcriptional regulator [Paenibacillus pabuli]